MRHSIRRSGFSGYLLALALHDAAQCVACSPVGSEATLSVVLFGFHIGVSSLRNGIDDHWTHLGPGVSGSGGWTPHANGADDACPGCGQAYGSRHGLYSDSRLHGSVSGSDFGRYDLEICWLALAVLHQLAHWDFGRVRGGLRAPHQGTLFLPLGLILVVMFVWHAIRKHAGALIVLRLFRNGVFSIPTMAQFFSHGANYAGQVSVG